MRAWTQDRYGEVEVVTAGDLPVPEPGRGQVLLRVRAVALNAGDVHVMRGDPYLVRPVFGLRRPRAGVRGMDVVGTVTALGAGVEGPLVGTEVVGEVLSGGLAEYVVARADRLVERPPEVPPEVAATLPVAGGTAAQALALGGLRSGARVLVLGASGGVGTFTVQLAVDAGAEVWATCGEANRALVERIGASRTYDHRRTELASLPPGHFDLVLEIAGTHRFAALRSLLKPDGTAVLVGGGGGKVLGPVGRILRAQLTSIRARQKFRTFVAKPDADITAGLLERVVSGRIAPVIEKVWPFDEADRALARVASGRTVGKVVVRTR